VFVPADDVSGARWTFEPKPKGLRWLFAPTAVLGSLALSGGVGGIIHRLDRGPSIAALVGLAVVSLVGGASLLLSLHAMTMRARYDLDTDRRLFRLERRSALGAKSRAHSLDAFEHVLLQRVRGGSSAKQPNPVGEYAMVLLVGPEARVHVESERPAEAKALAQQLSELTGLPVLGEQ
jgi:hypothetical protein